MSCIACNKFGSNCHSHHKRNQFGVKSQSIKGYSSLTKKMLIDFYILNGIDVEMSATKDKLFNGLKKIYNGLTPVDIKLSVLSNDTLANIRATKQRQKEADESAKKMELERKERERRDKIKKITYTYRSPQQLQDIASKRLPAGSKVKRLVRPVVRPEDIDDLVDMFSSARASPDEMSNLLSGLKVNFGKNNFGA